MRGDFETFVWRMTVFCVFVCGAMGLGMIRGLWFGGVVIGSVGGSGKSGLNVSFRSYSFGFMSF